MDEFIKVAHARLAQNSRYMSSYTINVLGLISVEAGEEFGMISYWKILLKTDTEEMD